AARFGLVELDATERVRRIAGVPPGVSGALRGFMFPGLQIFEPAIFSWMEPDRVYSLTRVTYSRLLAAEAPLYGFVTGARWINIDTPDARAAAERTLAERGSDYHLYVGRRGTVVGVCNEPGCTPWTPTRRFLD